MIYFIQAVAGGPIKIGKAVDVRRRLIQLQKQYSLQLTVLGVIEGYTQEEKSFHEMFAMSRVRGEWFEQSPELIDFIQANSHPFDCSVKFVKPTKRDRPTSKSYDCSIKFTFFSFWKEKEIERGRKITTQEVAHATGVSRATISAYLSNKVDRPDLEIIDKLCKYFGVANGPIPFIYYQP